MTDPTQQCPPAWREYNSSGVRVCGRPVSSTRSCAAPFYLFPNVSTCTAEHVEELLDTNSEIQIIYLTPSIWTDWDYNITNGTFYHHLWTYIAGATERRYNYRDVNCPCSPVPRHVPLGNGLFHSGEYYCESGNPTDTTESIYSTQMIHSWMGSSVKVSAAVVPNLPHAWFRVQLPTLTSDRIEVRIYDDEPTINEDIQILRH